MFKDVRAIISKTYEDQINAFFNRWIKGYFNIDHFAILIVLPNKEVVHISTNTKLVEVYNMRKYGLFDCALHEQMYLNWPFYPWRRMLSKEKATQVEEIHQFREKEFSLNAGTNFVRKIESSEGTFNIIYAIATKKQDPLMQYVFACNVNAILEIGDFAYMSLKHIFQENSKYTFPEIKNFVPFNGGIQIASFNNYVMKGSTPNKIIDFTEKSNTTSECEYQLKKNLKVVATKAKKKSHNAVNKVNKTSFIKIVT